MPCADGFAKCQISGIRQKSPLLSARPKALRLQEDSRQLAPWPDGGALFAVCQTVAHGKEAALPCATVSAHSKDFFRRVSLLCHVFYLWRTTKPSFAVCPWICLRRRRRHTANSRFPVLSNGVAS